MNAAIENWDLASKVAFITGAASGIGRAAALAFARAGASVVVADLAADGNAETARMINDAGGRALALSVRRDARSEAARSSTGHRARA